MLQIANTEISVIGEKETSSESGLVFPSRRGDKLSKFEKGSLVKYLFLEIYE